MYLVSACLAGYPCRYDGNHHANEKVIELMNKGQAIPICPEQLGGLTTPRTPCEICDGKVISKAGEDVTQPFCDGAKRVLAIAKSLDITEAILKANSPSCGRGQIYDGTFSGQLIKGNGMTAELLIKNEIKVYTENEMDDSI